MSDLIKLLGDWHWRINNLYYIIDHRGRRIIFKLNYAQENLVKELHEFNIILKARQLGFTTFIQIFMLDACIFNSNVRAGTIAHTMDDAKVIFRDKIKYPYDNLPDQIKRAVSLKQDNLTEMLLSNNSSIRVGVSLRSGTLQYLHVSEYGKICAKYPEKAREIRTGSLNTISRGQFAFIESTAEGREGHFFDLCEDSRAKQRRGEKLGELDFKFTFWPWYDDSDYRLDETFELPELMRTYFDELEQQHGIVLDLEQKCWYSKKAEIQLADMKREYPSTPDEAFEASTEGAYYGDLMAKLEFEGRIGKHGYIEDTPVHTAWDIGVHDYTAVWFYQVIRNKIGLVAYYQNTGEGAPFYIKVLIEYARRFNWKYGDFWFPHDARVKEWGSGKTRLEELITLGIKPKIVPKAYLADGINATRTILPNCYFNKTETIEGVRALKAYRKVWDDELACWRDKPRRDWSTHGADAFRYLALVLKDERPEPEPVPPIAGIESVTLDKLWKHREETRQTGLI